LKWLDQQVSLYRTHADNMGCPATLREVLFTAYQRNKGTIDLLRNLDRKSGNYGIRKKQLKAKLQCYTPSALLKTKKAGKKTELSRTGMLQLDFDFQDIQDYDIEELKKSVFSLPFIGFCGLSCGGDGFYALALIAEPYRLAEYAEHLFQVLLQYGIKADQSKGKKVENLRYVSYDENMLIRKNPEPLRMANFKAKSPTKPLSVMRGNRDPVIAGNGLVIASLMKIKNATIGNRWVTVQKVAYTLGGLGNPAIIDSIKNEIKANPQFDDSTAKFIKCAEDCFAEGLKRPFNGL
jgi:VirE N-terminal domain